MNKQLILAALSAWALILTGPAFAGTGQHEIVNPDVAGATDAADFPATCYLEADDVTNARSIYIDCDEFLAVDGDTLLGGLVLDDGSGASPSLTLTDGTDETAVFSKVDAGFLTVTTVAGDGVNILTGNLKVGNGTPGVTQDGEDAYIEGTLEVDGLATLASAAIGGGTSITAVRIATDTDLDNGQTSEVVTVTGATTATRCFGTITNDATNDVAISSIVTATDQATVTVTGDPGASGADLALICFN